MPTMPPWVCENSVKPLRRHLSDVENSVKPLRRLLPFFGRFRLKPLRRVLSFPLRTVITLPVLNLRLWENQGGSARLNVLKLLISSAQRGASALPSLGESGLNLVGRELAFSHKVDNSVSFSPFLTCFSCSSPSGLNLVLPKMWAEEVRTIPGREYSRL